MRTESPAGLSSGLKPILDTVIDAVVIIDFAGRILGWNECAERTFGYPASVAIGKRLSDLIIPDNHRAAHEAGMARLVAGAEPRVLNRRIEIEALDADGRMFPIELSITSTESPNGPIFIGFLRDITDRRRAERALERQATEAKLLFELTSSAAEAASLDEAFVSGLRTICELTEWEAGHAFNVVGSRPGRLVPTNIWHEKTPGLADCMKAATRSIAWEAGMGLPGTILETGQPHWVSDISQDLNFVRKDCGFGGGFGFPLKNDGKIVAILEFFQTSPVMPEPEQLLLARSLGEQIGRVVERIRRQEREALLVRELNHRAKNLLMVIQAIAHQTFGSGAPADVSLAAFSHRLGALARAHDLLMASDMREIGMRDAVAAAIEGAGNALDSFTIEGAELALPAALANSFVLAVHELSTNAMKYGALSVPGGRVDVRWTKDAQSKEVRFTWQEVDGPPVTPPARSGFGSRLIKRIVEGDIGGKVELDFAPGGLVVTLTLPGIDTAIG